MSGAVAAALALVAWAAPAASAPRSELLGRSPAQLRAEGWLTHRCDGATCAGPVVDGGPFGRGSEFYGIELYRGRFVVQYEVRLARAASVAVARRLVLAEAPPGTLLDAFSVSYAPDGDVDVATATSGALATWTRATDPLGKFCVYLASARSGRFVASDVRNILIAAWVKGASYGGC